MNKRSNQPLSKPMELAEMIAFEVIQPLLVERAIPNEDGELDMTIESMPEDERIFVSAFLDQRHTIVGQIHAVNEVHARLRLGFVAGRSLVPDTSYAVQLAYFLNDSGFHVRFDSGLSSGFVVIDSELAVRADDLELVEDHLQAALKIADQVEWFTVMMFPQLLRPGERMEMKSDDFEQTLAKMFELPAAEREAEWMFLVARGLGRWLDVLKILKQHPELMEDVHRERFRMLAFRMLGRWGEARKAAERAGIVEGRFVDAPWLSPSFLEILIELDDGIEVLRLIRDQENDEVGFYDAFRARAYLSLDMVSEADEAFTRYMSSYSGDLASLMSYSKLRGELIEG